VRAAAASLNAVKLVADYRDPENPHVRSLQVPKQRFAFGLVPGVNHSGIVPDNPAKDAHPTLLRLRQCLQVTTGEQYQALCERWEEDNRRFYAAEREKAEGERVAPHQQFLVRVRDDMGNAVDDYRLDFHVVDPTIRTSAWADNPDVLVGLQRYQRYTERLGEEVIVDVQPHSVHQTHRAFYVNIDALEQLKADLAREQPDAYIAMNLDASGPTADLTYDTDRLQYLEVEPKGSGRPPFFRANTSTLVEIVLQRVPGEKIFVFHQLQG
jgi:hypothetical protein